MLGSILRDISELKRAEAVTQHTTDLLSEALDIARLANWEYDVENDLFLFNDNFYSIFHTTAEREGGYSISSAQYAQRFVYPEDAPSVAAAIQKGLASTDRHYHVQREHRILYRDGGVGYILAIIHIDRDEQGRIIRYYGVSQDITQRKLAEEALQASESRYRGLFEDSPISLWEEDFSLVRQRLDALSEEGIANFQEYFTSHPGVAAELTALIKVLDVNKATMKMFGANQKEDLIKNLADVFSVEQNQEFQNEFTNIAEGRMRFSWEGINKTIDGRLINIELNWSAAPGYEKSLAKVIISMIDITERKRAEAALAKSEQDYRTLFENMPIGLYRTSADGRLLDANQAMVDMFGYKNREDLLAANILDLYVDPASDRKFKSEIIKTGVVSGFEAEVKRADGTTFWTEDHNHIVRDEKGNPLFYEGSQIDVTERKRAAAAMQQAKDFAEQVIQTANVIFIQLDNAGNIQKINKAAEEITGYGLSEVIGTNWGEKLVPRERYPSVWRELDRLAIQGETPVGYENPILTKHGEERDILWKNSPLYEGSDIVGLISFGIDITERKRAEEALQESRQRYRALFEDTPVAIWEQDYSALKNYLDSLKRQGLTDLLGYFKTHPKALFECAAMIRYLDANKAALKLYGAGNKEDLFKSTQQVLGGAELEHILEDFMAIAQGKTGNSWEGASETLSGDPIEISLNWSVAPGHERDYSKVIVTTLDITERRLAEKRIKQQLERLAALRTIDQVITSSFDLPNSLTMILRQVIKELGVDAADVLLLNNANLYLEYSAGVGFRTRSVEKASVRLGQSHAGRVALERQLLQIPDIKAQPNDLFLNTYLAGEDFACYVGVPLVAKGSVKGVLEVYHRTPLKIDQEWLDFLNTLAGQAALAIDNAQLFDNMQRSNIDLTLAYDATIEGWSWAMDLRDKETEGHTLRVTEMTVELAGLFGIKDDDLVNIRRGALLHDIGKMGIPDAILLKPAALTDEEWTIMRKHPSLAFELLSSIRYLKSAIDIPYCHHEKWDGTGYPRGLQGEQIPLPARIFAIVDVWDAVTSDRPYRKAWPKERAIEYLKSEAGKHFDPQVARVCLEAGVFDQRNRHPG